MCTGLNKPVAYLLLLIIVPLKAGMACQFDNCYTTFHERFQGAGIVQSSNPDYCQLLTNFNSCLQNMSSSCWGVIYYHSALTYISNEKSKSNCKKFPETMQPKDDLPPRCHHYKETVPYPEYRYCSLFGSRHLRTFNGSFETCARSGAYSFFDGKHFVIQITHSSLSSAANALTKVTVIVKDCGTCTQRKHYEASSDNEKLSSAFVDGTTFGGNPERKAVEIVSQNHSYIEIHIHHIATNIIISRQGPFLAVSMRVPESILREFPSDIESLCTSGCSGGKVMQTKEALANPLAFTRCHGIPLKIPLKIAEGRCAVAGVTDAFFDACVFDLMTTGNEILVSMTVDAQNIQSQMHPIHTKHYSTGRKNLSIYKNLAGYEFLNCVDDLNMLVVASANSLISVNGCLVYRLLLYVLALTYLGFLNLF